MALRPVIPRLHGQRVVLASASPRRQEILRNAGLRFEVIPSRFRETLDKASFPDPPAYAVETARHKALEVAHRLHQEDQRTPDLVIAADTIVAIDGLILEKPADEQDAFRMLSRLSGKEHSVFTGVAVLRCWNEEGGGLRTRGAEFSEETRVAFSELSPELLWDYVRSGEPMDKAGGYGIQAQGGMLVERVSGDFLNVVGFPLNRFCRELDRLLPDGGHDARGTDATTPPPPEGLPQLTDGRKASWCGGGKAGPSPLTTTTMAAAAEHGLRKLQAPGVVGAFDLSGFASACVLGGCANGLACELARTYPSMAVTTFHRLEDCQRATSAHRGSDAGGTAVAQGDTAADTPPAAELYALWGVPDDRARRLLAKMADARGVLLAVDGTTDGRPRRHGDLLRAAGFGEVREANVGGGHVVLATR